MPRWLQIILHALTTGVGVYAAYATKSPNAILATGITQAVVGVIAQAYNPDGTPAKVAYLPPEK